MTSFPPSGLCIFLLSAGALAYEVILVRLLSMTRFHHLAFMVLSLALLAYGASGVLLAYQRGRLLRSFRFWFSIFAALFAVGTVVCFQLSQRIPVFPGQWLWSPFAAVFLAALYLVLSLPLFGAAVAVGLAYCAVENDAGRVYRADLLGAAAGSLAALAMLRLPGAEGLWLPWCAGLAAATLMALPGNKPLALILSLSALLGPFTGRSPVVRLILSPDKPLAIALSAVGARKLADVFTPLGRITVTRNTLAPYRHAPGLSLAFSGTVAAQWGAFIDGDAFAPLLPAAQPLDSPAYLDYLPEALAYRLVSRPRVLLLDAPATTHLARAIALDAAAVDVVVANPGWRILLDEPALAPVADYFASPRVRLVTASPRGYLRSGSRRYDLIVIGPPAPSALIADHLHTVEALREALGRLTPNGVLSLSGPSDLPPRTGLRLLTTAAAALKAAGRKNPAAGMAFIRSLRSVELIVKNEPLTPSQIAVIRRFCSRRQFDPVWFPQMDAGEANRWNRIDEPRFYEGAKQLLGANAGHFLARYKFDVSPVFDDRPFFSRFLKPGTLAELFKLRGSGALGLFSLAAPVLAVTLVQALILSLLVVWLPLRRFRMRANRSCWGMIYLTLGTGFMLTEYAIIEKMGLFLSRPVLAVAVTLAAFLAMAGLGGGISSRCSLKADRPLRLAGLAALLAAGIIGVYALALTPVLGHLMTAPLAIRMALTLLVVTPLALVMGFPFPLAVSALKVKQAKAVPWAWGLNGCGSLVGPVFGMVLAVYGGVTLVLWSAALCYGIAFAAASISATPQ